MALDEAVGVTVGASIRFDGDAWLTAVDDGPDCSKLVSVWVKLRTGTRTIGGLASLPPQPFTMDEYMSSSEAYCSSRKARFR